MSVSICWFRQDLRLADNPALIAACQKGRVLPIYILDDRQSGAFAMGAASRWWLHHSLHSLSDSLGGRLSVYRGNPKDILDDIVSRHDVKVVCWNRCYEPWRIKRDELIKRHLMSAGIEVDSRNGSLLWEPWQIKKKDATPYKVFTPFYRKGCLQATAPREPLLAPINANYVSDKDALASVDQLGLLPKVRWDQSLESCWDIGERAASACFQRFLEEGLANYSEGRNLPAQPYVSRLSPYLHFGEISPHQLWYTVRGLSDEESAHDFCRQLGWREFSYSQLYYNPDMPEKNMKTKFDDFPWVENEALLKLWQSGVTGIPMVDAGMRELWQTGYMHNRVRMITASFLVKNLRLHWRHGERWFWNTLIDADLANNSAGWQWVAGCGADAAPYFRIFNPVTQGIKFDSNGDYVRQFVPELASMPNKYLFSPWEAPAAILQEAGIELGVHYPKPIVDLKVSRQAALDALQSLKQL